MKDHLNLLPQDFRDAIAAARRIKFWSLIFLLALILSYAAVFYQRQEVVRLRNEHLALTNRLKPLKKKLRESKAAQTTLLDLRTKHSLVSMLEEELPALQILGVVSQSAFDPERGIVVTDLRSEEVVRNQPGTGPTGRNRSSPSNPSNQEKDVVVRVTGEARDDLSVTTFVTNLRQSKMFRSVKLHSTS
ncbi:MAG: hypothetical protein KDA84_02635, partial [Planctomycetaceae bacterium]|nr:hypothetical protein [Planctomycetaceae bacterium]